MIGLFSYVEETENGQQVAQPAVQNVPDDTLRAKYNSENNAVTLNGVGFLKLRLLPQECPDIATADFMRADGSFTGYDVVSDKFIVVSDREISIQLNFGRYFGSPIEIPGATLFTEEIYVNINGLGKVRVN